MPSLLNRTKVVATIGPATNTPERLADLIDSGVSVCRLNFSHGTLDDHSQALRAIRTVSESLKRPVAVLGDLCGPKIRLNAVAGGHIQLQPGQAVRFARGEAECSGSVLTTNYASLVDEVQAGDRILIDDGLVRLLVTDSRENELICACTVGGVISSRKGVNLPDSNIAVAALTEKDRRDARWAIESGLDYLALSFVRRPEDVAELRALLGKSTQTGVVVKIEKREALDHLDALIADADGVMVARGDLGVEMDVWRVPLVQKDITLRARVAGVPVIIATQMLQSMITNATPTRAEVSDIANAILDGADAIMLSAETASGAYPSLAVDMMDKVARVTEDYLRIHPPEPHAPVVSAVSPMTSAIAHAAVQAARDINARLVAVWSATGATVRMVAQHRLSIPVVGLTTDERVYRKMALWYGVTPIRVDPIGNPAEMTKLLERRILQLGFARPGDLIVVVTSTRPTTPGATDTTLVHRIGAM
ncbi:MAG: pyruvate kinase [Phycisphaerales bacterium]|nr:pyruvate kinase [Phycisphaerales bacterium]